MSGGIITKNISTTTATGGVLVEWYSIFILDGGTISYNESKGPGGGGGVLVNIYSEMTMNGGSIHHNKATARGGGVLVNNDRDPTFTMNGGTIADNESLEGGGVYVGAYLATKGTFIMMGGTISGNTAAERGGGVMVIDTGVFKKAPLVPNDSSGVIYGYDPANADDPNANKVKRGGYGIVDGMGHAVYVEAGPKKRETTVMPDQHLDSGTAGGWAE
jgi:hypothetical protein